MKSYLKFISRNKTYTAIQVFGLFTSLAFFLIIGCYVWTQYSITRHNTDYDRIYILGLPDYFGLTAGFKDAVADKFPEIERMTQISQNLFFSGQHNDDRFQMNGMAIDSDFFDFFPEIDFIEGDKSDIRSKNDIVLNKPFALAHNIHVGDRIIRETNEYTVVGVVDNLKNTIFPDVDILVSNESEMNSYANEEPFDHFGNTVPFIKLRKGTDVSAFHEKMSDMCKALYPQFFGSSFFQSLSITRLDKVFFNETIRSDQFKQGDIKSLRILGGVALLLLLSAIFNYINLSTALVSKRIKEMAIRRLIGSSAASIKKKFIVESLALTLICLTLAILTALAFAPVVNGLLNDPLVKVEVSFSPVLWIYFLLLVISVAVVSGLVTAMIASKVNPMNVARGSFKASNKRVFSKIFIVLQNVLAIFLLTMAIVMEAQYVKSLSRPKNFNSSNKFFISMYLNDTSTLGEELRNVPGVIRVGMSNHVPGFRAGGNYGKTANGDEITYRIYRMDSTTYDMLGLEVTRDFGAPQFGTLWFSDGAFKRAGFTDESHNLDLTLLPERMMHAQNFGGTFKDFPFNISNTGEEDAEVVQLLSDEQMVERGYYNWVLETENESEDIKKRIQEAYEDWSLRRFGFVYEPIDFDFIDASYREGLRPARNNMRLLEIFMILALIISISGIIAMSTYYANVSAKSIAVKKVFGSTARTEIKRSVTLYMELIVLACIIGIPVSVWAARIYVSSFIYRIENYWWIFVFSVLLSLFVAFLSVIWQTAKAAKTNPATELKKE